MNEPRTFWTKAKEFFLGKEPVLRSERPKNDLRDAANEGTAVEIESKPETVQPSAVARPDMTMEPRPAISPAARRLNKKDPTLTQIKEGYSKVLHMMEKMELYFETNEKRALFLSKSVERFADTLDRLADTQKSHGNAIESIARSSEENGHLTRQIGEALTEMPASLMQLSDTLKSIMDRVVNNQDALVEKVSENQVTLLKQVDAVRDTHNSFTTALSQFGTAVDELALSSRSNAETFKRIGLTEMEQRHGLTKLVTKHTRRFTVIVSVMGGLALGALATIICLMIMLMDRPDTIS